MSLFLCITMLIGLTYAWFTTRLTNTNNIIKTGTLDVVLEYKSNWSDEWAPVGEKTKLFKNSEYCEPGYTEVVYLRVSNVGSLALKYLLSLNIANEQYAINVYGDEFRLSDHLQVGTYIQNEYVSGVNVAEGCMPQMFGDSESALSNVTLETLSHTDKMVCEDAPILPGNDTAQIVAIVLSMPEDPDNLANTRRGEELPYVELGVRLFATQYTHEEDSFDNRYDDNVDIPDLFEIHNDVELDDAFRYGGRGVIVEKHIPDVNATLNEDKSLTLNMNHSTLTIGGESNYIIVNKGTLVLTGDGLLQSNMHGAVENWGKLYVNNLNIDVKGIKYGFHCKAGEVEINNIYLVAERGGLNVQGGKLVINSGKVTTTNYKQNIGYLIYAASATSAEVIVNGGDFRYEGTYAKHRVLYAGANATIIVNGGTFGKGGANVKSTWIWEDGGEVIIYGGSFEFDPSEFVADGYEAVKGSDGWWTVSKISG